MNTFCEETHEYKKDGVILPSVTEIIERCLPRTDNAPEDAIYEAGLRGSWVDKAFADYLTIGEVDIPPGTPDEYKTCLEYAIEWWEKNRPRSKVRCQLRLFGKQEAGTLDLLVDDHEILDLKSTWTINSKYVHCQLGGYADLYVGEDIAEMSTPEQLGLSLGILHVHRRFKKAQFREIDYRAAWMKWRCVRDFYRLLQEK